MATRAVATSCEAPEETPAASHAPIATGGATLPAAVTGSALTKRTRLAVPVRNEIAAAELPNEACSSGATEMDDEAAA